MQVNCLILGAGAAGLMCAAQTGPGTLVIDHARAPAEKVRISGGGRCNFTNLHCAPEAFLSQNPHFCKSALSQFTQWDFLDLVGKHGIAWHEKTLGQLFCDTSSKEIVSLLLAEAAKADIWLNTQVIDLSHDGHEYRATLEKEGRRLCVTTPSVVIATGGKSIPKMGATGLAYRLARQFGLNVTETRPGLVPLTFSDRRFAALSGLACPVRATAGTTSFDESLLFTHRGLSGPAILQISSYWHEGEDITLDLLPDCALTQKLGSQRASRGKVALRTALAQHLPVKLINFLGDALPLNGNLADAGNATLQELETKLHNWSLRPNGSEGYRTAEVTIGGIDTSSLSSKTMEAQASPGLYVIGEAVDVTGWLGGYNFQWAWSSGWAAGQAIRTKITRRA